MSGETPVQPTPEDRAEAAARDLADRGLAVTARAVREAAGVRMAVAAQAAKAWREASQEDDAVVIPEVPEDVRGRLTAIWTDAYRAALAEVTPERDRLAVEVEALRAEVEALTATVAEVEDERDQAAQVAAERADALTVAQKDARDAMAATAAAEQRNAALEGELARLTKRFDALIEKLPAPATAPAKGASKRDR